MTITEIVKRQFIPPSEVAARLDRFIHASTMPISTTRTLSNAICLKATNSGTGVTT